MNVTATGSRPLHHGRPDPNLCPHCGAHESIRELAERYTWQPLTLAYDAEGVLEEGEYREFDYGDDVRVTGYECGECESQWQTLYGLAQDQRLRLALEDHAEFWELRTDRVQALWDADRAGHGVGPHPDPKVEIAAALARAEAFRHCLAILAGNGEA